VEAMEALALSELTIKPLQEYHRSRHG